MNGNLKVLVKKIFTKEELISVLEDLDLLQQLTFGPPEFFLKKAEELTNKNLYQFFLNLEEKKEIPISPKEQFDFLENLKKELKSLPMIKLEIAFLPSQKTIEKISQWLEKEIGKKIILDIYFNPAIAGGLILEYAGKYRDFSLAKEIDKIFPPLL